MAFARSISRFIDAGDWYASPMNVEDSYEGAVRRLQRLELAGVALESPQSHAVDEAAVDDNSDRMRQLEELALLACEDNERLKREFGAALQELDDARKELDGAHAEIEQLRGYIASLQPAAASTQANAPPQAFAAPAQPFVAAPPVAESWPFPEPASEEDFEYPPKSRGKGAFYFFVVAIIGAAVAALCVMRPWDRPHAPAMVVEPPAPPPPPPVVTAPPPPAPKVAPTTPTLAPTTPTTPTVAPTIPKVARAAAKPATKTRSAHKHAKHHAAKKHGAATTKAIASDTSDDPLGGTGL